MHKIHVTGIGGSGMLPLAELLLKMKFKVTGSDRLSHDPKSIEQLSPPIQKRLYRLKSLGAELFPQDGSAIDQETDQVIVSTAIEQDNPDLLRANELNIQVLHRAEALSQRVPQENLIAVTGTSGKTTTAALLAWVLIKLNELHCFVGGAELLTSSNPEDCSAVHLGAGTWSCLELDESDKSLLRFSPRHAIILNIARDHYALEENIDVFEQFAHQVKDTLCLNHDDEGCLTLAERLHGSEKIIWYKPSAASDYSLEPSGVSFNYQKEEFHLPLCGFHNISNALAVLKIANHVFPHYSLQEIAEAISSFPGTRRRLQRYGSGAISVFDDYAHNPDKVQALLSGLQERFPQINLVFQPHGYGPLRFHLAGFSNMFNETLRENDQLILLPVYDAGGTTSRDISSMDLAKQIEHESVIVVKNREQAIEHLQQTAKPGDAVVVSGARDDSLGELAQNIAGVLC